MLRITRRDGAEPETTLALAGRLTREELAAFEDALDRCMAEGRRVDIDLADVRYVDESAARRLSQISRRGVAVAGGTGFVRRLLEEVSR